MKSTLRSTDSLKSVAKQQATHKKQDPRKKLPPSASGPLLPKQQPDLKTSVAQQVNEYYKQSKSKQNPIRKGITVDQHQFHTTFILKPRIKNSASLTDMTVDQKQPQTLVKDKSVTDASVDSRKVVLRPRNPTDSVDSK